LLKVGNVQILKCEKFDINIKPSDAANLEKGVSKLTNLVNNWLCINLFISKILKSQG